ncbi:hypothetical protein ILYODFUR_017587 [Ilyodon furcidens]|uniref:Uncharacterized protein n=1 Tax=Ilyodon furcidens TaxID=33524 RepID=A0ABV0TCA7_9TELE
MASGSETNLSCPVCHDVYKDPVLLSCSHSFCVACLQSWWRRREVLECPVCKRISGRKNPPRNLALKNLCEAFLLEQEKRSEELCSLHSEKLKLFCLEHKEPICLICRDSERHTKHSFRPIDEAARDRRKDLEQSLKPLEDKIKLLKEVQENYEQTENYIKVQSQQVKKWIRKKVKMFHEFLEIEAEVRIAAVREEQKEKCDEVKKIMKDLKKRITSLSYIIIKTKNELRAEDVSFLRCYEAAAERVQQRPLMNDPQPLPGLLLDKVKHIGNLTFDIWRNMNDQYFPVILDPNTAHSGLTLTKDLTSVKWGNVEELPDNPERFDSSSIILGCEGFTTGIHSWEVEVGESQHWTLGVAPESVKRKGLLDSQSGLWTLAFHKGTYKAFSPTHPVFYPPVKKHLQKIRVHLNCDAGFISFSDPDMLIHSFRCRSTEVLFPFLGTTDKYLLKIQPDTICVLNNANFICDDRASSDPEEELIDDGDDQVTNIFHDD